MNLHEIASWYLIGLSVYHLGTGFISYLAPETAMKFYRGAYGADPVERRHLMIILRPWGALAVFAGAAGLSAVWYPSARQAIEASLLVLLTMRVAYRLRLRRDLEEISRIKPARNWTSVAMLATGMALLASDLAVHVSPVLQQTQTSRLFP